MQAPIEVIFYDEDDQEVDRFTRNRIPSYLLDMAIDLSKSLNQTAMTSGEQSGAEVTAPLFDFIVELFGQKFTREELKRQTDLSECFSVFHAVLARANNLAAGFAKGNPTRPSPKRK